MSVLEPKSATLGDLKDNIFVAVACKGSAVYAVTKKGLLCVIDAGRRLDKWLSLRATEAYSIAVTDAYIACGCSDGVVR